MSFGDMTVADVIAVVIGAIIIIGVLIYSLTKYSKNEQCKLIEVDKYNLKQWRINLYLAMGSVILGAFFTFAVSSIIRFIFHLVFAYTISYNMIGSLPAFICKYRKVLGTCKCDYYEYRDFEPMLALGAIGALVYAIFPWNIFFALMWLVILIGSMYGIYAYLPTKQFMPLKVPESLVIKNVEDYQRFLMIEPQQQKLVIAVSNSCKFCEMQINEINSLAVDFLESRVRIFDLSEKSEVDKILLFSLNLDEELNFPLPLTFVFNGGQCTDQKVGVISGHEIQFFIS